MRQPEGMTRLPRADDRVRRAAGALARRPGGSSHSRSVTPTASGPARSSATALSTPPLIATATRPGFGDRVKHAREGVRDGVRGERLAGHGRGLEQRQAGERTGHPSRVGLDDPLAFDDQPRVRVRLAREPSPRSPRSSSAQASAGLLPPTRQAGNAPTPPPGALRVPEVTVSIDRHEEGPASCRDCDAGRWSTGGVDARGILATEARGEGEPGRPGPPSGASPAEVDLEGDEPTCRDAGEQVLTALPCPNEHDQ